MKKPLFVMMLMTMFMTNGMSAQESTTDQIVLSDLRKSGSSTYFDVSLEGTHIYSAYNLEFFFPDGISIATNSNGNPRVTMLKTTAAVYPFSIDYEIDDETGEDIEVKTYTHSVSSSTPATNHLKVSCFSTANEEFTKTSGTLFRVYVTLDQTKFTFSPKPIIRLEGIWLIQMTGGVQTNYVADNFSCRPFTTDIPADRTLPINISATNKVGTLILPFDAALPEGVAAYSCNAVDEENETLTLTPASSFKACTPYIVYAENGYSGTINGTVDLNATYPDADIYPVGFLTGVLSPTVVNTGYIMQNQGDGPQFYNAEGDNFSLPSGRCYLTPTTASGVNAFGFNFDGANSISMVKESTTDNDFYDLSGRRVTRPTQGIYIQGKQKVLVK